MADTKTDTLANTGPDFEEQVVAYLVRNPDFLQRHDELVAVLEVPHDPERGTVSLIERQVQVLRREQQSRAEQLAELVATARDNERLGERLHRVILEAVGFDDLDHALDSLPPLIAETLDVQQVAIRVAGNASAADRRELVDPSDAAYADTRARVNHGRSVSDDRLPPTLLHHLFAESSDKVVSCMLIPLGGRDPMGVLAVGADTPGRFSAAQGTLYLDRLGQLLGACLGRLLP